MNKVVPLFPVRSKENEQLSVEKADSGKTNNEALHYHWSEKVEIRNQSRLSRRLHLKSNDIRHNCTNYDELCKSLDELFSNDFEKGTNLAVIKYECTTQALQWRLTQVRKSEELAVSLNKEIRESIREKKGIIQKLIAFLTRKDEDITLLESQIKELKFTNEKLKVEKQLPQEKIELDQELSRLEKELQKERKQRRKLAKNNQSLGGRLSHAEQWRNERDLYSDLLEKEEAANAALLQEQKILKSDLFKVKRLLSEYKVFKRTLSQENTKLKNKIKNMGQKHG